MSGASTHSGDPADKIRERLQYLETWRDRHQKASQLVPDVVEAIEQARWEVDALDARPPEARSIPTAQIDEETDRANRRIKDVLPLGPQYDHHIVHTTLSTTATDSATVVFAYVSEGGELGTPAAVQWASQKKEEYRRLQESHRKPKRVRGLLETLFPSGDVVERFDAAQQAYEQWRAGVGLVRTSAALEMRTLLDGLQGELWNLVRRTANGRNMTWEKIASRLFPETGRETDREDMLRQEAVRSQLVGHLSEVGKRRSGDKMRSLDDLWLMVVDHLFVVLTLVESRGAERGGDQ